MDDFEAQINRAFGQDRAPPPPPSPPRGGGPGPAPFEHDFHGEYREPSPPRRPRAGRKRSRSGTRRPPLERPDGSFDPRPPPPRRISDGSTIEERTEIADQIKRYSASFPEVAVPPEMSDPATNTRDALKFTLADIQQKLNARQELQLLQSGLITGCVGVEMASTFIPKNPIKLKGFATQVSSNIGMFEDTLKQIACKYGGQIPISVETQLLMLLLRCAVSTHTQNATMEKNEEVITMGPDFGRPQTPPPPPPPPDPPPEQMNTGPQ